MTLENLKLEKLNIAKEIWNIKNKIQSEYKTNGKSQLYLKLAKEKSVLIKKQKKVCAEIVKIITVHDCFAFGLPM
jgi:hypothetical protein